MNEPGPLGRITAPSTNQGAVGRTRVPQNGSDPRRMKQPPLPPVRDAIPLQQRKQVSNSVAKEAAALPQEDSRWTSGPPTARLSERPVIVSSRGGPTVLVPDIDGDQMPRL